MVCSSGCPNPGSHESYGECLRSKAPTIRGCGIGGRDATAQRKWDREVDRARTLMSKGIMPENTFGPALDKAERISDATGVPYRADA